MAKRDLITREDAIKTVSRWIKADMTLGLSLFEMMMNEIPIITEQEIVKPYLEKLMIEVGNLEINKPMMSGYGFKQKSPQEIKDEVMKLIDNLLSEQEGVKE